MYHRDQLLFAEDDEEAEQKSENQERQSLMTLIDRMKEIELTDEPELDLKPKKSKRVGGKSEGLKNCEDLYEYILDKKQDEIREAIMPKSSVRPISRESEQGIRKDLASFRDFFKVV